MKKLRFSFFFFFFLFTTGYLSAQKKVQPNIIWIIAEDMSQELGCYGNSLIETSNIDNLAKKGMRFTNVYTTASVCAPSRTALATGMYQTSLGACHLRYPDNLRPQLPDSVKIISHILKENGYQTLSLGKDDYLFNYEGKSFDLDNWDNIDKNKPFFAKICTPYSHRIFYPDKSHPVNPDMVELPPYYPNVDILRKDWAHYLENVQLFDRFVGNLLVDLTEMGLLKNTIIFVFSDHGKAMLRGKYWLYDSGIKIPLIIYVPNELSNIQGYKPGTVNSKLVSAIDISATTLSLARVKKTGYMHGEIFLGKDSEKEREYIFASADRIGGVYLKSRAVTDGKYKLIINYNNGLSILENSTEHRKARLPAYNVINILDIYNKLEGAERTLVAPLPLFELYDLKKDPFETNNLAEDNHYSDIMKTLHLALDGWMKNIDDNCLQPDSPEIQKHFIDYRSNHKEKYSKERFIMYLKAIKELEKEGIL